MTIARVFPRRTKATPADEYAFVGDPPLPFCLPEDITEVHVSATFTWDLHEAERLADAWSRIAPVKIGGPATGMRGEDFVPGRYLREGYVITSRGCPNQCWFCSVPQREGELRELPVRYGTNVLDDNLLACSRRHILNVFGMLEIQKKNSNTVYLTGGLEAKRLEYWHLNLFYKVRPKRAYFAYDTPDDLEPLESAAALLRNNGFLHFSRNTFYCYVLIGYPKDTSQEAETRLNNVLRLGFMPMAMLYRDQTGKTTAEWRRFQRVWARPAIIYRRMKINERPADFSRDG
jgi:hypothetical protein